MINENIQTKLDIKDDTIVVLKRTIKWLEAENAALKRNHENAVKMFKELLLMLDKVAEK